MLRKRAENITDGILKLLIMVGTKGHVMVDPTQCQASRQKIFKSLIIRKNLKEIMRHKINYDGYLLNLDCSSTTTTTTTKKKRKMETLV